MRRARRAEGGFTLIEALVALALLGLLAIVLQGALRDGGRVWRTLGARSEAIESVAQIQGFLRARLAAAVAPQADAGQPGGFNGAPAELAFSAPWPDAPPAGGLYRFRIAFDSEPSAGMALQLEWVPEGLARGGPTEGLSGTRILLDGVAALRLRYFGVPARLGTRRGAQAGPAIWSDTWDAREGTPALVAVEIDFADGRQVWPPFLATVAGASQTR